MEIKDNKEILNWGQLIDRLGDEELIKEVVPMFLNDSKVRFDALVKAVKTGDTDAIKLYAHAVRGAGRNVAGTWQQSGYRIQPIALNVQAQITIWNLPRRFLMS